MRPKDWPLEAHDPTGHFRVVCSKCGVVMLDCGCTQDMPCTITYGLCQGCGYQPKHVQPSRLTRKGTREGMGKPRKV